MVYFELNHTLFQHRIQFFLHPADARPHSFAVAPGGRKGDAGHSVVHQFLHQLAGAESGVSESKEESVSDRKAHVAVVNHRKAVAAEDFLHSRSAPGILAGTVFPQAGHLLRITLSASTSWIVPITQTLTSSSVNDSIGLGT